MVKVISAAIIYEKKLTVVRKEKDGNSTWILPGGKRESYESHIECLNRELSEELPGLDLSEYNTVFYGHFEGISPNNGRLVENDVYLFSVDSQPNIAVSQNSEEPIKEARSLPYDSLLELKLSDTLTKIVSSLRKDDHI